MIMAAAPFFNTERRELEQVLMESNAWLGSEDPLNFDLGVHRWLKEDREEAYSDWLKWIIEQLRLPVLVAKIFGIKEPPGFSRTYLKIA
jgi:hypothetical protein